MSVCASPQIRQRTKTQRDTAADGDGNGNGAMYPAVEFRHFLTVVQSTFKMKKFISSVAILVVTMVLAACAVPGGQQPMPISILQGTVEQITPTIIQNSANTGVGAIVGGVAGAGLGSLIGNGTGRDVAMVAGAVGGAMAGVRVANNAAQSIQGQQIFVRTDTGVLVEVTQPVTQGMRVGQRVFIQGNGEAARVILQ